MPCETCANWTVRRRRVYDNGDEVITYEAPQGKGHCDKLGIDTPPEFHCAAHAEGHDHVMTERIDGAPWEHFQYRPCPDCNGRGSIEGAQTPCGRCVGTARVRFYDDGYIGEESTRLHPKEKPQSCTALPQPGTTIIVDPSPIAGRNTSIKRQLIENTTRKEDQGFL